MRQEVMSCDDRWHHSGFAFVLHPHQTNNNNNKKNPQQNVLLPFHRTVLHKWNMFFWSQHQICDSLPVAVELFPLYPQLNWGVASSSSLFDSAQTPRTSRQSDRVCVCHSTWWITSCFPWAPCRRVTPSRRSARRSEHTSRLEQTLSVILRTCVCVPRRVKAFVIGESNAENFFQKTKKKLFLWCRHYFSGWVIIGLRF